MKLVYHANRTKTEMEDLTVCRGGVEPVEALSLSGIQGIGQPFSPTKANPVVSSGNCSLCVVSKSSYAAQKALDIDSEFYLYAETTRRVFDRRVWSASKSDFHHRHLYPDDYVSLRFQGCRGWPVSPWLVK